MMIFLDFKKIGHFLRNLSQGLIYQEILRFPQGFPQSFPQLLWVRNKAAIAAFFWQIIACGRWADGLEAMQFLHEQPTKFQVVFRIAAPLNDGGKNGLLGRAGGYLKMPLQWRSPFLAWLETASEPPLSASLLPRRRFGYHSRRFIDLKKRS